MSCHNADLTTSIADEGLNVFYGNFEKIRSTAIGDHHYDQQMLPYVLHNIVDVESGY
jgi:hypothetical protein